MTTQISSEFQGSAIVGITGTRYPDTRDVRFELSLETTERWRDQGLPLVVVDSTPLADASSREASVAAAYRERGAVVLRAQVPGIASQRQEGARYALMHGADRFLTHEPEKTTIPVYAMDITSQLAEHDMIVVGRTPESIESLPPVQRRTEQLAGWILEQTLSIPFDALAGPRAYGMKGIQQLLDYPAHRTEMNNWLYMYTTVLAARQANLDVVGHQVGLIYPRAMVMQETGNPDFDAKRYMQFRMQLDHLLRLPEVSPSESSLARCVLRAFSDFPADSRNEEQESMISWLETELVAWGYQQ